MINEQAFDKVVSTGRLFSYPRTLEGRVCLRWTPEGVNAEKFLKLCGVSVCRSSHVLAGHTVIDTQSWIELLCKLGIVDDQLYSELKTGIAGVPNELTFRRKSNTPLHRADGPACVCWHSSGDLSGENYLFDGVFHNPNGASSTHWGHAGIITRRDYRVHGKLDRKDGAAQTTRSACGSRVKKIHYKNGLMHNERGPAFTEKLGKKVVNKYYLDDMEVSGRAIVQMIAKKAERKKLYDAYCRAEILPAAGVISI